LGDAGNIRAARTKQGPFQQLNSFPEFRDLVVEPEPPATDEPHPISGLPTAEPFRRPAPSTVNNVSANVESINETGPLRGNQTPKLPPATKLPSQVQPAAENKADWKFWLSVFAIAIGLSVLIALFLPKLLK
jgi:hypothetical protein